MKKFFVLLFTFVFLTTNVVFAYDAAFKRDFYNGFKSGFFSSLSESLMKNGIPSVKVNSYIVALKGRLNQQELENKTWACVESYNMAEMLSIPEELTEKCFSGWMNDYMTKNADLLKLLK